MPKVAESQRITDCHSQYPSVVSARHWTPIRIRTPLNQPIDSNTTADGTSYQSKAKQRRPSRRRSSCGANHCHGFFWSAAGKLLGFVCSTADTRQSYPVQPVLPVCRALHLCLTGAGTNCTHSSTPPPLLPSFRDDRAAEPKKKRRRSSDAKMMTKCHEMR